MRVRQKPARPCNGEVASAGRHRGGSPPEVHLLTSDTDRHAFAKYQEDAERTVLERPEFVRELGDWLLPNEDTTTPVGMRGGELHFDSVVTRRLREGLLGTGPLLADEVAGLAIAARVAVKSSSAVVVIAAPDDTCVLRVAAGRAFCWRRWPCRHTVWRPRCTRRCPRYDVSAAWSPRRCCTPAVARSLFSGPVARSEPMTTAGSGRPGRNRPPFWWIGWGGRGDPDHDGGHAGSGQPRRGSAVPRPHRKHLSPRSVVTFSADSFDLEAKIESWPHAYLFGTWRGDLVCTAGLYLRNTYVERFGDVAIAIIDDQFVRMVHGVLIEQVARGDEKVVRRHTAGGAGPDPRRSRRFQGVPPAGHTTPGAEHRLCQVVDLSPGVRRRTQVAPSQGFPQLPGPRKIPDPRRTRWKAGSSSPPSMSRANTTSIRYRAPTRRGARMSRHDGAGGRPDRRSVMKVLIVGAGPCRVGDGNPDRRSLAEQGIDRRPTRHRSLRTRARGQRPAEADAGRGGPRLPHHPDVARTAKLGSPTI